MGYFLPWQEEENKMKTRETAAIFDMDGVIVNNDVYHFRAWEELCEKYGIIVSKEEVKTVFVQLQSINMMMMVEFKLAEISVV